LKFSGRFRFQFATTSEIKMKKGVRKIHERANELSQAQYYYGQLIRELTEFFQRLGRSEFGRKVDRAVLTQLEDVLKNEIEPELKTAWCDYLRLFDCEWESIIRVENKGELAVELAPLSMLFAPYKNERFAHLQGLSLKGDGKPGKKVVIAKLRPGTTKVTTI
jgi:hypothetical protein